MIKKISNIALVIWMIAVSVGIIINKHYSHGELYSARLFLDAPGCCDNHTDHQKSCCEPTTTEEKSNCCNDSQQNKSDHCCDEESEFLQLEDDYLPGTITTVDFELGPAQIILLSEIFELYTFNKDGSIILHDPSPPLINLQESFLLNENFRC